MKPINLDDPGCNPISSNCVIWQGPDLPCIDLCKGDTVSDVVAKLAKELCDLLEQFNISNYDLSCLDLAECEPLTFQALIQLLIDKICECCDGGDPDPKLPSSGCPDCEVETCEEFWYNNPQGDLIKTMQLKDYVVAIGNKVCDLISQIAIINATLINHENRIIWLESQFPIPPATLPTVVPCTNILPAAATDMDVALTATMQKLCDLLDATGTPTEIYTAVLKQCAGLTGTDQLSNPGQSMGLIPGWDPAAVQASDAITNMWLTICDMRTAIENLQDCCDASCDDIDIQMAAMIQDPNHIALIFTGTIPAIFQNYCSGTPTYTITDSGGGATFGNVDVINYMNNATGFVIDLTSTPASAALTCTTVVTMCFTDPATGTQCESQITQISIPTGSCPSAVWSAGAVDPQTSIDWEFTWINNIAGLVEVAVFTSPVGGVAIGGSSIMVPGNGLYTGTIGGAFGITCGTQYYGEIVIVQVPGDPSQNIYCPRVPVLTAPCPCCTPTGPVLLTWTEV